MNLDLAGRDLPHYLLTGVIQAQSDRNSKEQERDNWRVTSLTVATNKAPNGPYRGVGRPRACFSIERTMDEVARAVGRDPLEARLANLVRPDQMPYMTIANLLFHDGDYPNLLKLAAQEIDLDSVRRRQQTAEPCDTESQEQDSRSWL